MLVLALVAGCSSDTKSTTGRTQREADSVIGESALPGADVVKRARASQDSAQAAAAAIDTAAAAE